LVSRRLETRRLLPFDRVSAAWDTFCFGVHMNICRLTSAAALFLALQAPAVMAQATVQQPAAAAPETQAPQSTEVPGRADAYYDFTMGHIYEQQYENTSKPEYATQSIDFYKKAYALDPKSPVIGEP